MPLTDQITEIKPHANCVLIRLGPDPENNIYEILFLCGITRWDLTPLDSHPITKLPTNGQCKA